MAPSPIPLDGRVESLVLSLTRALTGGRELLRLGSRCNGRTDRTLRAMKLGSTLAHSTGCHDDGEGVEELTTFAGNERA